MPWDPLEATAFLYYYSRGMPSALVADFIFRKCGKTSEPRTEKDVLEQRETLPWDEGKAYLNLQIVNRLLAQDMPRINSTWENFLAKMEFDREERAGLKGKKLLGRIEGKKKTQDPLVNQMVVKDTPKSAFRSGTTVALAASLPGSDQPLLAPSPIPSSGFGYIGITGDASGFGGGYGSTPYPSTLQGPGNFAGASTGYASADFGYPSSQQASQGLGQSAYNNTGHMSPPRWQDEPEEYDTEQEVLDYQSKPPPISQQPPPSTQALPSRYWKELPEGVQDAIRKEKQDKQIAKSEGLKRQRKETQQRNDAKEKSQAEKRAQGRAQARAQARQAVEEDPSAGPSTDDDPEDDSSSRQPRKRRRAQHDRARSRSRSLSRLKRLAEKIELPKIYHGWRRDVVREMAPLIATLSTWNSLNQKYGGDTYHYYNANMLPDPETWGWVEIERVKHLKAMGRKIMPGSGRAGRAVKETGQQQKRWRNKTC